MILIQYKIDLDVRTLVEKIRNRSVLSTSYRRIFYATSTSRPIFVSHLFFVFLPFQKCRDLQLEVLEEDYTNTEKNWKLKNIV